MKVIKYCFLFTFCLLVELDVFAQKPVISCVESLDGMGTSFIIHGKKFTGTTTVKPSSMFSSVSFSVVNDSTISANVYNPGMMGGGSFEVITPKGDSGPFSFTKGVVYYLPPFYPKTVGPGDTLSITFDYFSTAWMPSIYLISDSCNFSSKLIQYKDSSPVKFLILDNCKSQFGGISFKYKLMGECYEYSMLLTGLTFNATPIINSVSPLIAKAGDTITITGKYLYTSNIKPTVRIGGVAASSVIPVSNYLIKAVVGQGASGDVTVTNSYNVTGSYAGFIYGTVICPNGNTSFQSDLSGTNYQWQVDSSNGFINIFNDANYSDVNNATLLLTNIPSACYGNQYRCLVDGNYSKICTLRFADIWTGTTDSVWENPANWSCGSVPDANTDVIINSGTIILNSNTEVRSLVVNPTVNFTINTGYTLTIKH